MFLELMTHLPCGILTKVNLAFSSKDVKIELEDEYVVNMESPRALDILSFSRDEIQKPGCPIDKLEFLRVF